MNLNSDEFSMKLKVKVWHHCVLIKAVFQITQIDENKLHKIWEILISKSAPIQTNVCV